MPIRINILAEQQALEEMRRKDPVKRAIWVGVLLAVLVLGWGLYLFGQSILKTNELSSLESALNTKTNEYKLILSNKKQLDDINFKLNDLDRLATNRFLMGNLLNALQQGTMDNVQVVRIKLDENYVVTEPVKASKPKDGEKATPAKPGKSTEKILLTIDAKDSSPDPGSAISRYQDKLSALPFFSSTWSKPLEFKLTHRGAPLGDISGRMAVLFTLECNFPETTR
jgi:hypothetical protein